MALSPPTALSFRLQAILHDSIKTYEKETMNDLLTHPLTRELQTCNSPTSIVALLRAQSQHPRDGDGLTRWLNPTVHVLHPLSEALGLGVGLAAFSPSSVVFAGAGYLLLTANDFAGSPSVLIDVFERIKVLVRRLEMCTELPSTVEMKVVVVKIMAEVLGIFASMTKEMKQARWKKVLKKLMGRRYVEGALSRMDRLAQEGIEIAVPLLKDKHGVDCRLAGEGSNVVEVTTIEQTGNDADEESPFPRPIRPQVFFGRDNELKTIIDLIFSPAPTANIAILGPGGIGKTILAHAVLTHEAIICHFRDSRYLIPCESLKSRYALIKSLARLQPCTTFDSVLSALRSKQCILCLDSFESPWDQPRGGRQAVEMLLADITALPSVTVLITMRGMETPEHTDWTLPRLPPLTSFSRDAAMRTWNNIAGSCDEWAEKLIDAVDCLPLAVALLGSLAEVSGAETLWERWQKENIALVEKEKGDKLKSLEFSITLSLKSNRMAADGSSRRLLGILSMLPDGMPASPPSEFQRLFSDIPNISQSLHTLLKCSLAIRTPDKKIRVNSLIRLYCERYNIAYPEDRRALTSRGYDSPHHELSEITPSQLNSHNHSQSLTPLGASPTSPPTPSSGPLQSFGVSSPSPMHDEDASTAQPLAFNITISAPQLTSEANARLPAVSRGGSASPATNAPVLFPFAPRTPSRSSSPARLPEHVSEQEPDSDGAIMSARAIKVISGTLDMAENIGHEAFTTGVGLLQLAPVPGLQLAGNILLNIWDAVRMVKTNHDASRRLTERCDVILNAIRVEIALTDETAVKQLRVPMANLVKAFEGVHKLLNKLGQRSFLRRYLGRSEIQSNISSCDTDLSDALRMFDFSIQIRTLNIMLLLQKEARDPPESHSHVSPGLSSVRIPFPAAVLQSPPTDPESVHQTLDILRSAQNAQDRAREAADLRQLMRTALAAKDDVTMLEILNITNSEIPEAIQTLERALERVVVEGQLDAEELTTPLPSSQVEDPGQGDGPSVDPNNTGANQCSADSLDRQFLEKSIGALRRLIAKFSRKS